MSALRASLRRLAIARARALPPILGGRPQRRPRPGDAGATLPIAPDRPRDLSGGAAAALEFEA